MSHPTVTRIVGLIGDPVAHSISPALHNAAFAQLGIDARYELWPTAAASLPARVESLRDPAFLGANVTLPHKVAVVPLLDRLDPLAEAIGAVNTIVRQPDGALLGANTDATAFVAALREDAGFEPAGQTVVVLGASGAARAAVVALLHAGVTQVVVVNRTLERAEALLADVLAAADGDPHLRALTPDDADMAAAVGQAALVVNATSIGWRQDETPLEARLIRPGALVYDMVYRPTRLLREAAAHGAATYDGLTMLARQAALAFERWTGHGGALPVMLAAARERIQAQH